IFCNVVNHNLNWFQDTNQYPVIGQTAYRIMNGRIEMIGQSWLKHGFFALSQTLCGSCPNPTNGSQLGVDCSDPYSAGLNGQQSNLGPKFEVDAFTGNYAAQAFNLTNTGNSIYKRLQIEMADLDPALNPNAIYVVEGQYVTPDDATAGNGFNNASWREVTFQPNAGGYDMALIPSKATHQEQPAVLAWQFYDPTVQHEQINIPGEGRFNVLLKDTDNGNGTHTYEYAIHNLNSHRSACAFDVNLQPGSTVTNVGFHDVPYHSGELWSNLDWVSTVSPTSISWAGPTFAQDPNANALRWGTTYNFRFTSDLPPLNGFITLFRPGVPATVPVTIGAPQFTMNVPTPAAAEIASNTAVTVDLQLAPAAGAADPTTGLLHYSVDGGAYQTAALAAVSTNLMRGTLPAVAPYSHIDYYFSIQPMGGGTALKSPPQAPGVVYQTDAFADLAVIIADDFQTDMGWVVSNSSGVTAGSWARGIPNGAGTAGDPTGDADGSGNCYVTGLAAGVDVDGGATFLTSPPVDLGFSPDALIEFSFWYSNDQGANPNSDDFNFMGSNDNGATWTIIERVTVNSNQWRSRRYRLSDYMLASSAMLFRFQASDLFGDSNVEAGVDAFKVRMVAPLNETLAAGNIGVNGAGGPFDVLKVNNSSGGALRHVVAQVSTPLTFSMDNVPTTINPVFYMIFGQVFVPFPTDSQNLGPIGQTAVLPCFLLPTNPTYFLLTNNFPINLNCQQIMGSTVTPWSATFAPGLSFPFVFTLQGIIIDPSASSQLSLTNAVVYETRL
ncbi:MAG: hypothetical protein KDB53_06830, partial [Planctomycetes bacterium]|nr:hypothetical protein [Planctomycetota bacterium]